MMPPTTLCYEYMDPPKFSGQKTHLSIWFLPPHKSEDRTKKQKKFNLSTTWITYFGFKSEQKLFALTILKLLFEFKQFRMLWDDPTAARGNTKAEDTKRIWRSVIFFVFA